METNGTVTVKRTPEGDAQMAKVHAANQAALRDELAKTSAQRIPLEKLTESPLNKRRTWGDLDELAKSLASVGILQDLVARPHRTKPGLFEVVFGHRRLRAAKIAKLDDAPVKVRELDDGQVVELQAIENLQRTDIHEMEEAEAFELLRQKQHLSAEDLAAKVGKSRAYVYARLKLLDLCPEARDAFFKGEMTASVALGLARVPGGMQVGALVKLRKEAEQHAFGEGKLEELPVRDALELLREEYTLRLATAPFDRGDAELVPGAGACKDCPKRSGNQAKLFGDDAFGGDDDKETCTDPVCFGEKRKAHENRASAKLEARGVEVLHGKRQHWGGINPPKGYVTLTDHVAGKKVGDLVSKARGKGKLEKKTVIFGEGGKTVEIVKKEDLVQATGVKEPARSSGFDQAKYDQERKLREAEGIAESAATAQIIEKIETLEGPALVKVLRLALKSVPTWTLREVVQRRGWKGGPDANIDKLQLAGLVALAVEILAEEISPLALHFKIDLKAMVKAEQAKAKEAEKRAVSPAPAKDAKAVKRAAKKAKRKK